MKIPWSALLVFIDSYHSRSSSLGPLFDKLQSLESASPFASLPSKIAQQCRDIGFASLEEVQLLARDFRSRPEVFSKLLQSDFGFDALDAHRLRAIVMRADVAKDNRAPKQDEEDTSIPSTTRGDNFITNESVTHVLVTKHTDFKKVVVNEKAKKRKGIQDGDYGLPLDCHELYPVLGEELDQFYIFMTKPSAKSQDSPIREATAQVYMRHARQFLGWYVQSFLSDKSFEERGSVTVFDIISSPEKESAAPILEFIIWLRSNRNISVSYEANLLRGIAKLLKFRFADESKADPSYGEISFSDIPLLKEIRKLHRDANRSTQKARKSSDESRKWLTWTEYLGVIAKVKMELEQLLQENAADSDAKRRKTATMYQYYLVLAFFASVPDRQRTIRELELGNTFLKTDDGNWSIQHGPDDYKTGKTYGERPPLVLPDELTSSIDDFLDNWRENLNPKTNYLFVQPRTGNPFTQDSVYQLVARNCFRYTGKKTNPHLLRDMVVTHVRDSDTAGEKQLEALALYMGHSMHMQRNSYDRRTLKRKVEPAIDLLKEVNTAKQGAKQGT